ncbi:MAG: hypothetical protein FWG06_01930 [Clostridiales bacterium]|nr:hypothetical protein [Clostridiales bacterium]
MEHTDLHGSESDDHYRSMVEKEQVCFRFITLKRSLAGVIEIFIGSGGPLYERDHSGTY